MAKVLINLAGNAEGDSFLWGSPSWPDESWGLPLPNSTWISYRRAPRWPHTNTGKMRVHKERHKTQAIYALYITAWKFHLFFLPFDWLVYFVHHYHVLTTCDLFLIPYIEVWSLIFVISSSFRQNLLDLHLSHLEQFDQALRTMSQISENFLSGLKTSSQVDVTDLEAAINALMVR